MFNGSNNNGSPITTVEDKDPSTTIIKKSVGGGISGGLQLRQLQKEWFQNSSSSSSSGNDVLNKLEQGQLNFPYKFEYKERGRMTSPKRTIVVRQMEIQDLQRCVAMCLREYGKYPSLSSSLMDAPNTDNQSSSNDGGSISKFMNMVKTKIDDLDNFVFSFVVLLGLEQRVNRRLKADATPSLEQDHNVLLVSEVIEDNQSNSQEIIFGMAEISLQPPDPSRTSPPFVIPTNIKNIMTDMTSFSFNAPSTPSTTSTTKKRLCAYISNVLITNEYRSKGYSKILMSACHGIARSWGYEASFLHVDADAKSGRAAQQLYRKLGYKPYIDESYNEQFTWMGIDSVNRGLYIVDGIPLLFLKKDL